LAHRRIAKRAARQFRHVVSGRPLGLEHATRHQLFTQGTDQRLGDREHDVPVTGALAVEVALEQHRVTLHHQKGVRLAGDKVLDHTDAQPTLTVETQLIQRARGLLKLTDRPWPRRHINAGAQSRQMTEPPLIEGRAHPVVPRYAVFRRGGKPLHQQRRHASGQ